MNLASIFSSRHLKTDKENFNPAHPLPTHKPKLLQALGQQVQNIVQASIQQEKMQIEDLVSIKSVPIELAKENPQHVPMLQTIILNFLKSKEDTFEIDPDYMSRQKDINSKMRAILIDWLIDVNLKFKLLPQTLFMTVNIIDRYLTKHRIERSALQLVGIAALMLISKYEEIYPPVIKDFVAVCDHAYTKEQILEMEAKIITTLDFNLTQTSSFTYLEQLQLKAKIEPRAFAFARYILENALMDISALKYGNLLLATGAILLVFKIFKIEGWKQDFEAITLVSETDAKSCAKDLYVIMQKIDASSLKALKRKFAAPEFFELSKYKIERVLKGN